MPRPSSSVLGLIVLIFCIGLYLRFHNITQKGLFFHDEGYFLLVAKTYYYLPAFAADLASTWRKGDRIDFKAMLDTYYHWGFFAGSYTTRPGLGSEAGMKPTLAAGFAGKPGFLSFVILSMFIVGPHADYASTIVSAAFGAAALYLVFLIGRDIGGWRMGFLCSALLAVSPAHVLYSREGLSPATTSFFLSLFLLFYLREKTALSGLCLGYALSTHESILLLIPVAVAVEAYRGGPRRSAVFFLWILLPLLAWEAVISLQKIALGRLGVYHRSFFQELFFHGSVGVGSGWDPWFYADLFLNLEGLIPFLLFVGGAAVGVFLLRIPILLPLILVPLGVWSVFPGKHARLAAPYFPWIAVVSASFLESMIAYGEKIAERRSFMKIFSAAAAAAVILLVLPQSLKIVSLTSGYPEASRYVRSMGRDVRVANIGQEPLWRYYLDKRVLSSGDPKEIESKADVFATEGIGLSPDLGEYLSRKPYKELDNDFRGFYPLYLEDGERGRVREFLKASPGMNKIKIYEIHSIKKPESAAK